MVITDNRNHTIIQFHRIAIGECFEHNANRYLRVSSAKDVATGNCFNAISLYDGAEAYFLDLEPVAPLNVHLIIEDQWFPDERDSDLY